VKDIVNQILGAPLRSIRQRLEGKESGHVDTARISEALEKVVENTDSTIRYVRGYRRKLFDATATALAYADSVVDAIPGAVEVSRKNFLRDPYVNAFFVNTRDLQTVFSHSSEIREYLEDCNDTVSGCYALLCMRKTEKTVFGVQLDGDVLRHDVRQTSVSFSDHRIYSPAATEPEARDGLRHCLFHGLGTHALERIMRLKVENHHLQQEHHELNVRLRQLQRAPGGAQSAEAEAISRQLRAIEQNLLHSRMAAPEESLHQVQTVLAHPEDYVRVSKSTLRLNRMCIKVDEDSGEPCNTVHLTEVTIGNEAPRVVTLAKFPGEELLPSEEFLEPGFLS